MRRAWCLGCGRALEAEDAYRLSLAVDHHETGAARCRSFVFE